MQPELEASKSDSYLLCNYRLSDKTVETIKADVKGVLSNRQKDVDYYKFMNWHRKKMSLSF
jgi:hypothetical protein